MVNFESIREQPPNLAATNSILSGNDKISPSAEKLWDYFFKTYHGYARHRDLTSEGQYNYFIRQFSHFYEGFINQVAIPEQKSYFDGRTQSFIDPDAALEDWALYLEGDEDLKMKSSNALIWAFEILKSVIMTMEDLMITKSEKVRAPAEAINIASEMLRDDPRAKFEIPKALSQADLAGQTLLAFKNPNWAIQHENNLVKVFRDDIRINRELVQKKLGAISKEGSALNTSILEQSRFLKSIITLNASLVKKVTPKGR